MVFTMQYSGYSKKFLHEVVNAALKAYSNIGRKADCGARPLYRPMNGIGRRRTKPRGIKLVPCTY